MRTKITDEGLVALKDYIERFFEGADEVEIQAISDRLVISPVLVEQVPHLQDAQAHATEPLAGLIAFDVAGEVSPDDPFFNFGKDPITDSDIADASVNLDKYLYG